MNLKQFLNKIRKILKEPQKRILYPLFKKMIFWLPDELYLKILHLMILKRKLDLNNPSTFNEKLQWLKLHDHNPLYIKLVDKYEVRKYVRNKIGEKYLIPILGVWDSFDEINFKQLPDQFVLKCTHDSGSVIICKDKSTLDIKAVKKKIDYSIKRNYYYVGREWPYKFVKPRIIAEEYLEEVPGEDLKDYKLFCFHGKPKIIEVDIDRYKDHKRNLYSTKWRYIPVQLKYPTHPEIVIDKPENLERMLTLASELAGKFPHVRVDFYSVHSTIFFGEMTFYHGSGFNKITPLEFSYKMGSWIHINPQKTLRR